MSEFRRFVEKSHTVSINVPEDQMQDKQNMSSAINVDTTLKSKPASNNTQTNILKLRRQHSKHVQELQKNHQTEIASLREGWDNKIKEIESKYENIIRQKDEYIKMLEACVERPTEPQTEYSGLNSINIQDVCIRKTNQPKPPCIPAPVQKIEQVSFKIDVDRSKRDLSSYVSSASYSELGLSNRMYLGQSSHSNILLAPAQSTTNISLSQTVKERDMDKTRSRSTFAVERNSKHQIHPMKKPVYAPQVYVDKAKLLKKSLQERIN